MLNAQEPARAYRTGHHATRSGAPNGTVKTVGRFAFWNASAIQARLLTFMARRRGWSELYVNIPYQLGESVRRQRFQET